MVTHVLDRLGVLVQCGDELLTANMDQVSSFFRTFIKHGTERVM